MKLEGERYVTVSRIIPNIKAMNNKLLLKIAPALKTPDGKTVLSIVESYIRERLSPYEERLISRIATFLDSRFRRLGFSSDTNFSQARKDILSLIDANLKKKTKQMQSESTNVDPKTPKSGPANLLDFLQDDTSGNINETANAILIVENYMKSPKLAVNASDKDVINNLQFRQHEEILEVALRFLGTPGSSVPCERLFSTAGQIVTKRRNRLAARNIKFLIFLNNNYDLVTDTPSDEGNYSDLKDDLDYDDDEYE